MPFYDLSCACGNEFNVMARMSELEEKTIECPSCGSKDLRRVYNGTVNMLSDMNRKSRSRANECPNAHVCGAHCHH